MNDYKVDYELFYSTDSQQKNIKLASEPMNQLINRYNIKSKNILSVGSAMGFEEYWFHKSGCELTLIDLDEHKSFRDYIKKIIELKRKGNLRYIIDDVKNYKKYLDEKFDVVYFSSFTPNELRNRTIRWFYKRPYIGRPLKNFLNKTKLHFNGFSWPKHENPFLDIVIRILDDYLKDGGLFIYQTYASGVIANDKNYIQCVKNQLQLKKIQLVEMYCYNRYPNIHLIIGIKGNEDIFFQFKKSLINSPEIKKFHGRGIQLVRFNGIKKIYDFLKEN